MKVVCESCQAKYQVPDERVAGKKLKIRCKRCGATVLIRGDLTQTGLSDQPAASPDGELAARSAAPAAELEWHASVEGQSFGPFDTSSLLRWLDEQPGGWDAHVWRDGFSDWVEVRACPELSAAAPAAASEAPSTAPGIDAPAEVEEEEGPTRTFSNEDVGVKRHARTLAGAQASDEPRSRGSSSIRTRSSPALQAAPAAAIGGGWAGGSAASASPRVTAAQALTGERHEDSVLFSTSNLQQVAMTNSQPGYGHGGAQNPGFASGEASGLIDIRALASLARQTTPQIAPGAAYDRFRADDDSRMAVMNQTGAFNRVDSLAPVSTTSTSSTAAVPLAILGGFALVAAAAFGAILITRDAKQPEAASIAVVPEMPAPVAATAQPTVTPEPAAPEPAAEPTPPAEEQPAAAPAVASETSDALANGKPGRRARGTRTASEEKKGTLPAEKAKPKKEEKAPPPSVDDVMLAAKPEKAEKAEAPKHEPKPKSGGTDIDDLLGGTSKPAAKTPAKSASIDDLLEGAVNDKGKPKKEKEAPAPAPVAAAGPSAADDLPAQPSRDEVVAAMRGVEPAVKQCAGDGTKGVAEVQITVTGNSGRVTNATVTGITGEVGSCIARAARNAKFPHFSKPTFQVKFPYRLQ